MSVQERHNETGVSLQYTKGAIEEILPRCKQYNANGSSQPLDQKDAYVLEQAANLMANRGLRVLAFARGRTLVDLEFVGLFGLHDPPRQVNIFKLLEPAGNLLFLTASFFSCSPRDMKIGETFIKNFLLIHFPGKKNECEKNTYE